MVLVVKNVTEILRCSIICLLKLEKMVHCRTRMPKLLMKMGKK